MSERLLTLTQRDVRNLLRFFAEPVVTSTPLVQAQELGLIIPSGHHPAVLAEQRILTLIRATRPDHAFAEASSVVSRLELAVQRHLEAAFDPQPETFDLYTRRDAGLDFHVSATTAKSRLSVTEPHDPYFDSAESALLRFTPTLTERASRRLEKARAEQVYEACKAAGADAWETAAAVADLSVERLSDRADIELAVVSSVEKAIATVRTPGVDPQAREQARTVLATAKREAAALYVAAADAYARVRSELFPARRGPRSAPRPVQMGASILDPRAWQDAAAE